MSELRSLDSVSDGRTVVLAMCRDKASAQSNDNVPGADAATMTVLYDGACPLCRREVGLYRGLNAIEPLCFEDVSDTAAVLPAGTTRGQLLARFHVRQADGKLLNGAQAFLAMWAILPGWRWLARIGRVPGAAWLMEQAYRGFLHLRPALQRWAARLDRPATGGSAGQ